jgi:hypothetical protein
MALFFMLILMIISTALILATLISMLVVTLDIYLYSNYRINDLSICIKDDEKIKLINFTYNSVKLEKQQSEQLTPHSVIGQRDDEIDVEQSAPRMLTKNSRTSVWGTRENTFYKNSGKKNINEIRNQLGKRDISKNNSRSIIELVRFAEKREQVQANQLQMANSRKVNLDRKDSTREFLHGLMNAA